LVKCGAKLIKKIKNQIPNPKKFEINDYFLISLAKVGIWIFLIGIYSNRSGRLFLVCSKAISSLHLSILAKFPLVNTSGTFHPL